MTTVMLGAEIGQIPRLVVRICVSVNTLDMVDTETGIGGVEI
jgi:hypothetical protein